MEDEYSTGGSKIYRYSEKDIQHDHSEHGSPSLEEIDAHITKYLGEASGVFHEIVSPDIHIDVHLVSPTPKRNFHTLITSGMSDKPMKSPFAEARYAELVVMLPPEWKLDQASFDDEANYWPIRQMKGLARFPHTFNTWLWGEHTVPNGDPPQPYASNTQFCGMLLSHAFSLPREFCTLKVSEEKTIYFFALIPIYNDEMDLKLKSGVEALYQRFDKAGVNDIVDITRPSSVKRSWFGGLFSQN